MNQAQQNIALLASGLALGVIAGILLAPQSGRATREELRQRAVNASSVGRGLLAADTQSGRRRCRRSDRGLERASPVYLAPRYKTSPDTGGTR